MKIIRVLYDKSTKFILDIVKDFEEEAIVKTINVESRHNFKQARAIQTNFGTKNLPLIVFEDENLEEVAGIWSESNPDWRKEIKLTLDKLNN